MQESWHFLHSIQICSCETEKHLFGAVFQKKSSWFGRNADFSSHAYLCVWRPAPWTDLCTAGLLPAAPCHILGLQQFLPVCVLGRPLLPKPQCFSDSCRQFRQLHAYIIPGMERFIPPRCWPSSRCPLVQFCQPQWFWSTCPFPWLMTIRCWGHRWLDLALPFTWCFLWQRLGEECPPSFSGQCQAVLS